MTTQFKKRLKRLESILKPRIIKVITVFAYLKSGQTTPGDGSDIKFEMLPGYSERNPDLSKLQDLKVLKQATSTNQIELNVLSVVDPARSREREQLLAKIEGEINEHKKET